MSNRKHLIDKHLRIAASLSDLEPAECEFDSELVAVDGGGKAAFPSMRAPAEDLSVYLEDNLFDFLGLDGHPLADLPLVERWNHLKPDLAFPFDGLSSAIICVLMASKCSQGPAGAGMKV